MPDRPFEEPRDAEAAFYRAFEAADLEAMMAVWLDSDDIVCVHPMGPRLTGRTAVRSGWADIFTGGERLRFELLEPRYTTAAELSVHHVIEEIRFGRDLAERSRVTATNVYVRTEAGWRMQAHHGSPGVVVTQRPPPPPARVH